jgi:hypothetical protein
MSPSSEKKYRQKIQADIWNIEPKDGSIYRRVTDPSDKPREEYILCTDPSAKKFKAITNNDLKKWIDQAITHCVCSE